MAHDLFHVMLAIAYLGFFTHRAFANTVETAIRRCRNRRFRFLDALADCSYAVFIRILQMIRERRENVLLLLVRQNNPEFNESIKLFFGDIMGLDNNSEHIDLVKALNMDFNKWSARYQGSIRKLHFKMRSIEAAKIPLSQYLRLLSRRTALILRIFIPVQVTIFTTIRYIYNHGGLKGYEK